MFMDYHLGVSLTWICFGLAPKKKVIRKVKATHVFELFFPLLYFTSQTPDHAYHFVLSCFYYFVLLDLVYE